MEPAVVRMLDRAVYLGLTFWATLKTRGLRGFKSSEKPGPQAEASPQQAESLAAAGGQS